MNPPFVRPTNHEGKRADVPVPSFAAFETTAAEQEAMSNRVRRLTKGAPSHGNAGLASEFVELAHRKVRDSGTVAMVLPLSAVSGISWDAIRTRWHEQYEDIIVVTVAGAGSDEASFSADTDIAECLLIAKRVTGKKPEDDADSKDGSKDAEPAQESDAGKRGTFVILNQQVQSAAVGELLATEISRLIKGNQVSRLEDTEGITHLRLGEEDFGTIVDAAIPASGPWPLGGTSDSELVKAAYHLEQGQLLDLTRPESASTGVAISKIGDIAGQGPVDRDINGDNPDRSPRGPFAKEPLKAGAVPSTPILWRHNSKRERKLMVRPDSQGVLKAPRGRVTAKTLAERAKRVRATATRAHYNRDLQFNSQSLVVAMTEQPCIGGRAWPSVIFEETEHEFAFALWCNSTLGLLLHWWVTNKSQSGRGTTTVTGIPVIPTLAVTKLTPQQISDAKTAFEAMRDRRFLPFDQIDEDPSRAEARSPPVGGRAESTGVVVRT